MAASLWGNRSLIWQMALREVRSRYTGSMLGILWSMLQPLLMLLVYTFVFSVVFQARWSGNARAGEQDGHGQFALLLFVGLIVHALFAEVVNRSPSLVVGNANYVKKVVFPLETLPVIALGSALFHAAISIAVMLVGYLIVNGTLQPTLVFLPLVLMPLVLVTLGAAWILAATGVFLRDIGQVVGILTGILMFLSPIFFPVSSVPEPFRVLLYLNPLTFIIEQSREVLIWGRLPDFVGLAKYMTAAAGVASVGFYVFQKTRKGFADVL